MISELKLKLGKEDERLCLEIKIICQIIINKDDNDILVKDEIERNCTELSIRMVIDVANNLLEFYQMEGISIPPIEEMQDVEDE